MSLKRISEKHTLSRRKDSRISCPGCGKDYSRRYFSSHQKKYLQGDIYLCERSGSPSGVWSNYAAEMSTCTEHSSNTSLEDITSDSDSEIPARQQFTRYLRDKFQKVPCCSDDEELAEMIATCVSEPDIENWHNVHNADVEDDLCTDSPTSRTGDFIPSGIINSLLTWLCLFICLWQASHSIPDSVIGELLCFLKQFFEVCANHSTFLSGLAPIFPGSLYLLWTSVGLKRDSFRKFTVCRKCYTLYPLSECSLIIEGSTISRKCSHVAYPNHPQTARRSNCGEVLMKTTKLIHGQSKLYPKYLYCYKSIKESLQALVLRQNFENECRQWKKRPASDTFMYDIYDGRVWKEFMSEQYDHFLCTANNFAIMLNLDWFQPFEHVSYSVGVLYLVVLNLPRQKRFKRKNIILVSIIPDLGGEPKVNTFLKPLVDELKEAWHTGFQLKSYNTKKMETYKLALICVGCDIPATRKLCGFLSHSANLGCSKCMKCFPGSVKEGKDFSGFDRENWPQRQLADHKKSVNQVLAGKTQTDIQREESRLGVRYSALLELPYFDVIRMSVVDPMHNLFLGTSKKMLHIWLESGVIVHKQLVDLQEKADGIITPAGLGRLPRKIATSFSGFTADQWKNWTVIFSIYALKGILPREHLECWRKFVLACQMLCRKQIQLTDLGKADTLLMEFCSSFQNLFGNQKVTPNMHLHGHLKECILDYGPVYSFWLFSFERYNGMLAGLPNNNRSIEIQIMRRFLRDSHTLHVTFPDVYQQEFAKSFDLLGVELSVRGDNVDSTFSYYIQKLSNPLTPVVNQNWVDLHGYDIKCTENGELSEIDMRALRQVYQVIYPWLTDEDVRCPVSCQFLKELHLMDEVFGTEASRQMSSCFIVANWSNGDGEIIDVGCNRNNSLNCPGVIEKFIRHNLIVGGTLMTHLFAKVRWYYPLPENIRNYCGKPVEVWSKELFSRFGAASFMPVQRIYCKFAFAYGKVHGREVMFVCPLSKGMNI